MPGYKVFLEDDGEIHEGLTCAYCKLVLKDPVQTSESGLRLCRDCYDKATKDLVYTSTGELDANDVIHSDVAVKKEIGNLRVKCENYNVGCDWKGLFKQLMQHSQECQYVTVECSNTGCGQLVVKAKMEAHLKEECLYRQAKCKDCGREMLFIELQDHAVPKACKNCGRDIPACKVIDHMMLECRHVRCVCKEGSVYEVGSGKFHDHLQDVSKLAGHLEPIICEVTKISEAFKEMTVVYQQTTKRLDVLEKDHQGATQKIDRLEKYHKEDIQRIRILEERNNELEEKVKQIHDDTKNRYKLLERKVEAHEQAIQENSQQFVKLNERIDFLEKRWGNLQSEIDRLKRHTSMAVLSPKQPFVHVDQVPYVEEPNSQSQLEEKILELEKDLRNLKALFDERYHNIAVHPSCVQLEELCSDMKQVKDQVGLTEEKVIDVEAAANHDRQCRLELELHFQVSLLTTYDGMFLCHISEVRKNIRVARNSDAYICSVPFYTGKNGYKMCIMVYLNGCGTGYKTHLSIFFVLMKGEYDPLLQWPFEPKVSLILVDQDHKRDLVQTFNPDPQSSSFQKPKTDLNDPKRFDEFATLSVLDDTSYVKDDVMYIKVIVDTSNISPL